MKQDLTDRQLDILRLLFRFRFGTVELVANAQGGVSKNSAQLRLTSLTNKGLIVRRHDGNARLQHKPAVYSLGAAGRKLLAEDPSKYSPRVLNAIRANRNTSDRFIQYNLTLFSIHNTLNSMYKDSLVFLTKSNMDTDEFHYLPEMRPDAFMYLGINKRYYFLYLLDNASPDYAHIRRLASFFEYEKSGKWEMRTRAEFPHLLVVCPSKRLETLVKKRIKSFAITRFSTIAHMTTLTHLLLTHREAWLSEEEVRQALQED